MLYGRSGCHLCEVLADELARLGVPFVDVDVDSDAALRARYGARVPVLAAADGRELAAGRIEPAGLRARLGLE
ncbi:MAG TPA: glutaredoxin family protein [Burkholderiales bacterium]|nr:glutaredoxin family protein [Burkholderiales bacterium]